MADTNQQDLSMEDILSSIRNILMDEDGNLQDTATVSEPDVEDIEDLSDDDAVFDLSKEMLIEDKPVLAYEKIVSAEPDQDVDSIEDIDSLIGNDLSIDELTQDISAPVFTAHEQEIITETEDQDLTDNLIDDLETALVESDETNIEENLTAELIEAETESLSAELNKEIQEELLSEPDPINMEETQDESQMPSFTAPSTPLVESDDDNFAPEELPADVVNSIIDAKSVESIQEVDTSSDPIFDESLSNEVAQPEPLSIDDTSEDILSRLASIFEEDQQRKIIEDLAREEISEQTQKWLDKNLQSIVTDLVKKELERVISKVSK